MLRGTDFSTAPTGSVVGCGARVPDRGSAPNNLADAVLAETGQKIRRDTISNIENDRRDRVTIDELMALSAGLGISRHRLILHAVQAHSGAEPIDSELADDIGTTLKGVAKHVDQLLAEEDARPSA